MSADPDFSTLKYFPGADWEAEFRAFIANEVKFLPDNWADGSVIKLDGPVLEKLKADGERLMACKKDRPIKAGSILSQAESVQGLAAGLMALMEVREPVKLARPMTAKVLNAANDDLMAAIFYCKSKFNAARPSAYLPELAPMFAKPDPLYPGHPGYPSGHAAQSRMVALIYAHLFPELKGQLIELADDVAFNREVAGVHFRSDSIAGQQLAEQVVELLVANPVFANMLRLARVEWPGNLGLL